MRDRSVGLALLLFGAMILPVAGPAVASPTDAGTCIACHPIDSSVVVSTSFQACMGTAAIYSATVNNPYGAAGYGLFRVSDSAKLGYGWGSFTSFVVSPNTGFSFQGVSAPTSGPVGGANFVEFTSPNCQIVCTDQDGDTYNSQSSGCGLRDCNDNNAGINPGAAEIRLDGIDQDCNGYDLTITITKAQWAQQKQKLTVEATSSYGANAALQLNGYGAMSYSSRTGKWSKIVSISANPGSVTVSGPEGSWSSTVTTQ